MANLKRSRGCGDPSLAITFQWCQRHGDIIEGAWADLLGNSNASTVYDAP